MKQHACSAPLPLQLAEVQQGISSREEDLARREARLKTQQLALAAQQDMLNRIGQDVEEQRMANAATLREIQKVASSLSTPKLL